MDEKNNEKIKGHLRQQYIQYQKENLIIDQIPLRRQSLKINRFHPEIEQILNTVNSRMCKIHKEQALTFHHLQNQHSFINWSNLNEFLKRSNESFTPIMIQLSNLIGQKRFEKREDIGQVV